MSKGLKTVLAIGAAIAIPFAAPMIATSLAASFGVGALSTFGLTVGSALTGAALGAASNRLLGGSARQGALTGAIGGGLGGYFSAANAAQPVAATGTPAAGAPAAGAPAAAPVTAPTSPTVGLTDPTRTMSMGMGSGGGMGIAPIAPSAGTGGGIQTAFAAPGAGGGGAGISTGISSTSPGVGLAVPGAGATPTAGYAGMSFSNAPPVYAGASFQPQAAANTLGSPIMAGSTGVKTGAGGALQTGGTQTAGVMGAPSGPTARSLFTAAPSGGAGATAGAGGPAPTFMEALGNVPGELAAKFKDPKALADLTLRAGAQLAGSALAGDGLSDEEKQLLEARTREMQQLQQQNAAVFAQRMNEARMLADESRYYDPQYFGQQRARQAQIAGGRAAQAGTRGLTGGARSTAQRRYELETARNVGSAYDVGYGAGVQGRLATRQAGLNALPSPVAYESPGTDVGMAGAELARRRRRESEAGIGQLLAPLYA